MPVYDFDCIDCEIMFEEKLSITESDKTVSCPFCQNQNTKKRLSIPMIFKKQTSAPSPSPNQVAASRRHFSGCPCC